MSREAYFRYLEETAEIVGPLIGNALAPYREKHPALYDDLMLFAGTRIDRPLQKPALFRVSFEICGGKQWERFAPVAAAFELLNISSYQANSSFDNKLGALTQGQKDAQFICAMVSRELAVSAIRSCNELSESLLYGLEKSISHINLQIYLAQYFDLFLLHYARFGDYIGDETRFLADYRTRCYLGSGVFNSEICFWGGKLANAQSKYLSALKKFGEAFGSALQVANDIGDYAPDDPGEPNPRDYQDKNSDFRNGRLTAILWWLLRYNEVNHKEFLPSDQLGPLSSQARSQLSNLCIETGAYDFARKTAAYHLTQAKRSLLEFDSCPEKALLQQLASVVLNNKYSTAFRKAH